MAGPVAQLGRLEAAFGVRLAMLDALLLRTAEGQTRREAAWESRLSGLEAVCLQVARNEERREAQHVEQMQRLEGMMKAQETLRQGG